MPRRFRDMTADNPYFDDNVQYVTARSSGPARFSDYDADEYERSHWGQARSRRPGRFLGYDEDAYDRSHYPPGGSRGREYYYYPSRSSRRSRDYDGYYEDPYSWRGGDVDHYYDGHLYSTSGRGSRYGAYSYEHDLYYPYGSLR